MVHPINHVWWLIEWIQPQCVPGLVIFASFIQALINLIFDVSELVWRDEVRQFFWGDEAERGVLIQVHQVIVVIEGTLLFAFYSLFVCNNFPSIGVYELTLVKGFRTPQTFETVSNYR